ncbi:archease [Candidatus Nitrosotenuis sp. DW1]|uniref:archease n=1 Tax=Candidatus Nitrosotenuis sp. DW1 TaxID=2259672 RepID=UPI0015C78D7B|nr:archease [Candidatus Nitrosotenuis sp. DW1]QLH09577.1 archease [Candidatus Nitrosotenuis sp. DW1]
MSYRYLEHATDAIIEVEAPTLEEAFVLAGKSVVDTILDSKLVEEKKEKTLTVTGKDLSYLLYNWLEEMIILTITDGFAAKKISLQIEKNSSYKITAVLTGEDISFEKHHFKVEIKSPTFHLMEIKQENGVMMRFLLDL